MRGLRKHISDRVMKVVDEQADLTNMPHIGVDDNVAYSSLQLNIASAVSNGSSKCFRHVEGKANLYSDVRLTKSLGKYGGSHIDAADSESVPTAMTILSRPHPDIEEEYFYMLDCGIAWAMEEFSTVYFSGLHFHGGSQPVYRDGPRQDPQTNFYRLTLIAYPPSLILDGKDAVAFAALPSNQMLRIGTEMRNPM